MLSGEGADVVVVGTGISGLVATARLARAGARVVAVESNHQPGGLIASVDRQGFRFDVGPQALESLGILFPMLEALGLPGREAFVQASFRVVGPRDPDSDPQQPGFDFDFPMDDWQGLREAWKRGRGVQGEQVDALIARVRPVQELFSALVDAGMPVPGLPRGPKTMAALLRALLRLPAVWRATHTHWEELCFRVLGDAPLARLLGRSVYRNTDLFSMAGFYTSWFRDYWQPVGGMAALVGRLVDAARAAGADFLLKRKALRIRLDRGRVAGLIVQDGPGGPEREIPCRRLVWTGSPHALYGEALAGHPVARSRFAERVRRLPVSDAILSVFVGLDLPPERLRDRMQRSHVFYFPDDRVHRVAEELDDPDAHRRAWVQLLSPALLDPSYAPPGKSALVLQVFSDAAWLGRWGTEGHGKGDRGRPRRYRELKEMAARQVLETASDLVPELRDRVAYLDAGSPLSLVRFTHGPEGSTVGWPYHPGHGPVGRPWIQTDGGVDGLRVAGHWWMQPGGVPFAALSGWLAGAPTRH